MKLIEKDAILAEIDRIENGLMDAQGNFAYREDEGAYHTLCSLENFIDSLEMKEMDLDGERRNYLTEHFNVYEDGILQSKRSNLPLDTYDVIKIAKHFFELGVRVNNPITAADRGMAEEIIINLKMFENNYRIDLTREIEWLRNKVKKGEKV